MGQNYTGGEANRDGGPLPNLGGRLDGWHQGADAKHAGAAVEKQQEHSKEQPRAAPADGTDPLAGSTKRTPRSTKSCWRMASSRPKICSGSTTFRIRSWRR
jgi:hypothetical protein